MQNKLTNTLLAIIIFLPFVTHARLGDTFQDMKNRLGNDGTIITGPIDTLVPDSFGYSFEKNGIKEIATFWHGKSVGENYSKTATDLSGNSEGFSDEEIKSIVANNNCGGTWSFGMQVGDSTQLNWQPPNSIEPASASEQDNADTEQPVLPVNALVASGTNTDSSGYVTNEALLTPFKE